MQLRKNENDKFLKYLQINFLKKFVVFILDLTVSKTMKYVLRNGFIKVTNIIVVEDENFKEERHERNFNLFGRVVFQVVNNIVNDESLLNGWLLVWTRLCMLWYLLSCNSWLRQIHLWLELNLVEKDRLVKDARCTFIYLKKLSKALCRIDFVWVW